MGFNDERGTDMAQTVEYWDGMSFEKVSSGREYEPVGSIVTEVPVGDYYRGYEKHVTELWLDPITGLVVGDIEKYEAWVK